MRCAEAGRAEQSRVTTTEALVSDDEADSRLSRGMLVELQGKVKGLLGPPLQAYVLGATFQSGPGGEPNALARGLLTAARLGPHRTYETSGRAARGSFGHVLYVERRKAARCYGAG